MSNNLLPSLSPPSPLQEGWGDSTSMHITKRHRYPGKSGTGFLMGKCNASNGKCTRAPLEYGRCQSQCFYWWGKTQLAAQAFHPCSASQVGRGAWAKLTSSIKATRRARMWYSTFIDQPTQVNCRLPESENFLVGKLRSRAIGCFKTLTFPASNGGSFPTSKTFAVLDL